ncbi:MAG: hypothetical protein WBC51_10995 [Vicinamibacterales bacterium]
MTMRLSRVSVPMPLVVGMCVTVLIGCGLDLRRSVLPATLSDGDFWRLSGELSEPGGVFTHSENLVSNEILYVHTIRRLRARGGAYIGVGPEQNFSYIARLRPAIAFIVDIRRENRNLHLMYKALFEVSADRADFVSRLFSRQRPAGLGPATSVREMFDAYANVRPTPNLYQESMTMIRERLVSTHRFLMGEEDLEWIAQALRAFYTDGPEIHYGRSLPSDAAGPSYRTLMTATDLSGTPRSYLATEDDFSFVKDLQARNVIVPIVGDFAGQRAIRGIGNYIREHRDLVQAFYGSNVEVYLNRAKVAAFCGNLATLPHASSTPFIDNKQMQTFRSKLKACAPAQRAR